MGIQYQPLAATATFSRISQRRPTDRAEIVVRTWIVPTIAAAFETYPELDVADVLDRCAHGKAARGISRRATATHRRDPHSIAVSAPGRFPGRSRTVIMTDTSNVPVRVPQTTPPAQLTALERYGRSGGNLFGELFSSPARPAPGPQARRASRSR